MAVEIKMDDILYLHSSEQVPFGKLSPLYREKLKINQEDASNVISYCYAGLLEKGGRRNGILSENGREARTESLKYFREEKDELYNESMYNGLFEKIKQDPRAKQSLLESGNDIIVYQSENIYLGVNSSGEGQNIIGSMLMKIRIVIQKQVKEDNQKRFKHLVQLGKYNIYIVHKSLEQRILNGIDDLSDYIGKMPDEIISTLNLSPFPGKFDIDLPEEFIYFLKYPRSIAEVLRNQYADEYNDQLVKIKKRQVLNSFLIKNAIKDLPTNHDELYDRYKQLTDKKVFNQEYESLSKIFRPIVSEINSFIQKIGSGISELEDRIYFLASQNMLDGISSDIDKPVIKVSQEYIEVQRGYRNQEQKKLLDLLKDYNKKEVVDTEDVKKKNQEKIEKQKKAFREAEEKFYKSEKNYMKEAAKIAEREYMRNKGFQPDSEDEDDSESEESDSDDEIPEKMEMLYSKYKQNYKQMYDEVLNVKRYLKNKEETERLLEEYNKKIPKQPFKWKRVGKVPYGKDDDWVRGKQYYELTPSDEVILDDSLNQIIPIKRQNKPIKEFEILPAVKGKTQRFPVSRSLQMKKRLDESDYKSDGENLYDKEEIFDILLKYSSSQEDLKELPILVDSFILGNSQRSETMYKFSDSDPLSPSFIDFLEINHFVFPNVYYYIYFKLLASISPKDQVMFSIYNILLINPSRNSSDLRNFKPIDELKGIYNNFEGLFVSDKLTKRAKKVLNEKFRYIPNSSKDRLSIVCKLLISSYPRGLIYDSDDLILGFSKGQGYNIIGRIMMEIRDELLAKYGLIKLDEFVEEIPEKERRERRPLYEFIQEKTKEFLYVFSNYVDYIKNKTDINDEDVSFILDILYKNCSSKIKKILESIKHIPPMPISFEKQYTTFLKNFNYTINKSSLEKLWSHVYILNELYYIEVFHKNIYLFDSKNVGSFGKTIDQADENWFISSVKKLKDVFGNVDVSLGINYNIDGKAGSMSINRINIYNFKDKNLEEYYNNTIMKLLTKLKTDTDSITRVFVTVYETPISVIRQRYVKEKEKACSKSISIKKTENEKRLSCVVDTFISILKKLKKKGVIQSNINDSILLFINRLLSISGSINKGFIIKNLSTYEQKEDEDQLYETTLSQRVKNLFLEKGFSIDNIDDAMILLKNLAYHPNYNDVMARVLSFSEKEDEGDYDDIEKGDKRLSEDELEKLKRLFREKGKVNKRFTGDDYEDKDDESDDESDEEKKPKKKKKSSGVDEELDKIDEDIKKNAKDDDKKRKKESSDEEEDEESDGEEGYDIDLHDVNSEAEDEESEGDEDLLFDDDNE